MLYRHEDMIYMQKLLQFLDMNSFISKVRSPLEFFLNYHLKINIHLIILLIGVNVLNIIPLIQEVIRVLYLLHYDLYMFFQPYVCTL